MNNFICPIPDNNWERLVNKYNGNELQAFKVWEAHNFSYPDEVFEEEAKDSIIEEYIENTEDKYFTEKEKLIEGAKATLLRKIKQLNQHTLKQPHLKVISDEFSKVLRAFNDYEADAAIVKFIQASERIVNSSTKWLDTVLADPEKANAKNLKRIYESVSSLNILSDITEEYFTKETHKEEFNKIQDILGKINNIHNKYQKAARTFLKEQIQPSYGLIRSKYLEEAEREYNTNKRALDKEKGFSKTELEALKQDYIYKRMLSNKNIIEKETSDAVDELLIQTTDISSLLRFIESPKDMHHDLINFATKLLDVSARDVRLKTIEKTHLLDSLNQEFIKYVGKEIDPKKQYESILDKDENGNTIPVLINPNSKGYASFIKKNKDNAIGKFHAELILLAEEKNNLVGKYNSINYNLPFIQKSTIERVTSGNLMESLRSGVFDHFRVTNTDTEFGTVNEKPKDKKKKDPNIEEVRTSNTGKEREEIPIFYRRPVKESDLSYDVVTSMLLDYNNSLQYSSRLENGIVLDILKDVVKEIKIEKRVAGSKKLKIDKATKIPVIESSGLDSNLLKALDSLIRHRIYGISVEGDPQTAKILSTLKNYTSKVMLGGNILSGAANYLQGQAVILIETAGGKNNRFGVANRLNASNKFNRDIANIVNDIGEQSPKSKTVQLLEYFNVAGQFNQNSKKFILNDKAKKVMGSTSLSLFNDIGEIALQSVLMYSRLDNIKAIGKDGNYLDKDLKSTKDRSNAIGIDQVMSFDKGKLIINPVAVRSEITKDLSEESLFDIEQDLRRISRDVYGNYDQLNKSELQRNAWGALVTQMRNWIIPGIRKRYKGISNFRTKNQDLDLKQRNFNIETNSFEEGTYTTTLKFLYNSFKEIRSAKLMSFSNNWNELTNYEKGNFKKSIVEFSIALGSLAIYAILSSGDDEEDKDNLLAIYLSRRLYSELISYINIKETIRTFKTPAMSANTLESTVDLLIQAMDPNERYVQGKNKGELKIKKKLSAVIPLWKQYDRDVEESLKFLEK